MKVSVIMPVCNAADTVGKSLDSIRRQTFHDFELIVVDDGSTDSTFDIVNDFAETSGIDCKIHRMPENKGVASARNEGLRNASGDYIVWVDADDTIEAVALEKACSTAENAGADIVGWDWNLAFATNSRVMRQADWQTAKEALTALMGGTMRWNLWLFMVRRELLLSHDIRFIDGADMGEDMMFMLKAFMNADTVIQTHDVLYDYNAVSAGSLSRRFSELRRSQVTANVVEVEKSLACSDYGTGLAGYISMLKLYVKLPLLISADRDDYETWYSWFAEANPSAAANRQLPLRTRLLQWMASRRCWIYVRLYYLVVYKLIYGVIYR